MNSNFVSRMETGREIIPGTRLTWSFPDSCMRIFTKISIIYLFFSFLLDSQKKKFFFLHKINPKILLVRKQIMLLFLRMHIGHYLFIHLFNLHPAPLCLQKEVPKAAYSNINYKHYKINHGELF